MAWRRAWDRLQLLSRLASVPPADAGDVARCTSGCPRPVPARCPRRARRPSPGARTMPAGPPRHLRDRPLPRFDSASSHGTRITRPDRARQLAQPPQALQAPTEPNPRHRSAHGRTSSPIRGQPETFSSQTNPRGGSGHNPRRQPPLGLAGARGGDDPDGAATDNGAIGLLPGGVVLGKRLGYLRPTTLAVLPVEAISARPPARLRAGRRSPRPCPCPCSRESHDGAEQSPQGGYPLSRSQV